MTETMVLGGRTFDTTFFPRAHTNYPRKPFTVADFRKNVLDKIRFLGRGEARFEAFLIDRESAESGTAGTFASLAEMFAKRISSKHVKNVIFLLFGEVGSGKSISLLNLALHVAIWMQHLNGGKVTDYFDMSHVAVIDDETIENTMNTLKPKSVYILDDAAASGFSARNSMTTGNKSISAALQVIRPLQTCLLISAPHSAMLDCQGKRLAQYYGEMDSTQFHNEGISMLKIFRLSQSMRDGQTFHSYLTHRNQTAIRHYCELPPPELKDAYDRTRREQTAALTEKNKEKINAKRERNDPKEPKSVGAPAQIDNTEFVSSVEKYMKQPITLAQMAEELGMHGDTLRKYLKKNGFKVKRMKNSLKSTILRG